MIAVKATREGLIGGKTASGWRIDTSVPFVALPSTLALGKFVRVRNPRTGIAVRAIVLDVGPWNTNDHRYVLQPATFGDAAPADAIRPQAETGTDRIGRPTNKAAIDLGEAVWHALGMSDNDTVEWEFA